MAGGQVLLGELVEGALHLRLELGKIGDKVEVNEASLAQAQLAAMA